MVRRKQSGNPEDFFDKTFAEYQEGFSANGDMQQKLKNKKNWFFFRGELAGPRERPQTDQPTIVFAADHHDWLGPADICGFLSPVWGENEKKLTNTQSPSGIKSEMWCLPYCLIFCKWNGLTHKNVTPDGGMVVTDDPIK